MYDWKHQQTLDAMKKINDSINFYGSLNMPHYTDLHRPDNTYEPHRVVYTQDDSPSWAGPLYAVVMIVGLIIGIGITIHLVG